MTPQHRILIVNDDPAIAKQITALLDARGREYILETTGKGGLDAAVRYDFSLAFIDLSLPDMPADEFYAQLVMEEAHYTLPIVTFIDGLDPDEVSALNKLVSIGQVTLLSKPPKTEWLTALLDKYLS